MSDIVITPADAAANRAANQANAATAIYGISGSGKSNLADTAAEYCWETFKKTTLCYAADLGGFGNKRLALIRAGIVRVWDPRNHVNAFATMESMTLGAWPETVLDVERGYADPSVRLILPRRVVSVIYCKQGHEVAKFDNPALLAASQTPCPTCGLITSPANCERVEKLIVRHRLFADVGCRIYDSFTALNDWGMSDLQNQSAHGTLSGSALTGADALTSGEFKYSTGSRPQYGFLQNRTYGWLSNIKTIPDQVVPAICTFLVEQSKTDEDSGGQMVYGPKIAGSARTAAVASWVGNLLHASKEPFDATSKDAQGQPALVHRLWTCNHIDPRDMTKTPYMAKHRGVPLDMPDYLQDPWDEDQQKRKAAAFSGFSLKVFFRLLQAQLETLDAQTRSAYPDAPAFRVAAATASDEGDEVIGTVAQAAVKPNVGGVTVQQGTRSLRRPAAPAAIVPPTSGVATAQVGAATPNTAAAVSVPGGSGAGGETAATGSMPTSPAVGAGPGTAPPSPITQQLQATLAAAAKPMSAPVPPAPPTAPPRPAGGPRPLRKPARPPV